MGGYLHAPAVFSDYEEVGSPAVEGVALAIAEVGATGAARAPLLPPGVPPLSPCGVRESLHFYDPSLTETRLRFGSSRSA